MTLYDLLVSISLDTSEYDKGMDASSQKAHSFGDSVKSGFGKLAKVGATAVAGASAAVAAFGGASVKTGMDFDKSMSQVAATMGTTVDEITNLRDFAQEMGSKTAFSASQAADALNYMALAGYDAEKSMKMLPNVLNLAAAGGMELAQASDMVTDASSALGLTEDETAALVDKMAQASSKANTSVEQLGSAMLTVGGTAKSLKGGTTELSAALGILADNGTKGAEGGTALRNILTSIQGKKFDQVFGEMGISAYDAEGNLRSLKDVFADMNEAMDGLTDQDKTKLITSTFNARDLKNVNALLATEADRWDELSTSIDNSAGAAERMANTQLDNLAGDLTIFKSAVEGAQIAISDNLSPALRDFVQEGTSGVSEFTELLKGGDFAGAMESVGSTIANLATIVISKVPELIQAGGMLLKGLATGFAQNIPGMLSTIVPTLMSTGLSLITSLGNGMVTAIPQMIGTALSALTTFISSYGGQILSTGLNLIINLGQGVLQGIPVIISYIPKIVSGIWGAISSVDWVDLGKKVINGIVNGIKGIGSLVPAALKAIAKTAILAFRGIDWKGIGKTVISFIATAARGAGKLVLTALSTIGKLGINAFKKIDWRGVGKTVITFIGNAIRGAGGLLLNALRTAGTKAWQGFKSINWLELGSNIISGIIRGIGGAAGRLFGKLRSLASDALGAAKKVLKIGSPSKLFEQEVGKNIILGWAKGIDENAPLVERAIADVNSGMMDAFTPMTEFPLAQDMEVSASPLDINSDNPIGTRNVNITNYITVDGAKDPEEWTSEFVRTLKLEMRTA